MADRAESSFWTRDTVHYPRHVLPLFVSFGLEPVEIGSAQAYKDWSVPLVQLRYRVHHGYVYQRDEPVGGDSPAIMARFPVLFNMWRIHLQLRKRVLGFDRFVRDGGMEKAIFKWREKWKPEALELMTSQMKEIEANQAEHPQGLTTDGILHGLPGAPGSAQGPVRIVLTADDFARVKAGDILACPFTTPSWTVLFPKVAGLVTDSGGALSHAAIVAREYGLPAVVGTGSGTRDLTDGQIVRIDGTTGTVEVIGEEGSYHP